MKTRNIIYIVMTLVFAVLTYIFIDIGINVKTKNVVTYQEKNDVNYKVILFDNGIYSDNVLDMGGRYISSLVNDIELSFNYKKLFANDIYGYYAYSVTGDLIAYKDDISDIVWDNKYTFLDDQVKVLNQNDAKSIKLDEKVIIDFDRYKNIFDEFIKVYGVDLSGYLQVNLRVQQNLNFRSLKDDVKDEYVYKVIIPLSSDTFKIELDDTSMKKANYYDFSNKERMNYLFLVFGALCFSVMVASLSLVILDVISVYKSQDNYTKELKKIFKEYGDILVGVKRFYNKKKYNLIYVDSFNELLDVYNRIGNPITYREVKKNIEIIFLITDGDNAWIYQMVNEKKNIK